MSAFICAICLCLYWLTPVVPPVLTPTADLGFVQVIMTKLHILCWHNLSLPWRAVTHRELVSQANNVAFAKYTMVNFH